MHPLEKQDRSTTALCGHRQQADRSDSSHAVSYAFEMGHGCLNFFWDRRGVYNVRRDHAKDVQFVSDTARGLRNDLFELALQSTTPKGSTLDKII